MESHRILIEPQYSVEVFSWQGREMPGQPGYGLLARSGSGGRTFLVNPHAMPDLSEYQAGDAFLIIRYSPQLLIEAATRLGTFRTGSNLLFRQAQTEDPKLATLMRAVSDELRDSDPGWREMVDSMVRQLAVYLLRSHFNLTRTPELELSRVGIVDRRLRRAIEFMHDNCERELSLAEISAAVYVSAFHFARLFKKLIGVTPHHYLQEIRIERARKLLAGSDLSINEIGASVGYASQSHFTKIFKEMTGLTPAAFREAARR